METLGTEEKPEGEFTAPGAIGVLAVAEYQTPGATATLPANESTEGGGWKWSEGKTDSWGGQTVTVL